MNLHKNYMQRCFELAAKGLGKVAPNPMVGCVIVHEGKIIGEGYHQNFGAAHAEVNAINEVGDKSLLPSSILYVNLEPCSHFGKTPPCADLIIKHKIATVVISNVDPNPEVAGNGIKKMQQAGVEVVSGVLTDEGDFLNRRFMMFHKQQRPYIILKVAQSKDGFMAPDGGGQFWLTNEISKTVVHKWRTEEQAVMVGTNTVRIDNPQLTARLWQGNNPLRITFDRDLKLESALHIFNTEAPTLVFNAVKNEVKLNVEWVKIDFENNTITNMLQVLYQRGIISVMVEGGEILMQQFIKSNLWDEARVFTTPHLLTRGKATPAYKGRLIKEENFQNDNLKIFVRE